MNAQKDALLVFPPPTAFCVTTLICLMDQDVFVSATSLAKLALQVIQTPVRAVLMGTSYLAVAVSERNYAATSTACSAPIHLMFVKNVPLVSKSLEESVLRKGNSCLEVIRNLV